ncbi:ATP-binding protein [Bdellovibrio bacteriovorus]|uniref:ATP-binding protein n=1 Tax=Bdellovibrio bacteriovorus TaxID=959 RepID=UPI0035A6046D
MLKSDKQKNLLYIFAVAVLYYVTGKVGLLLALPPGYATLTWAPLGLSIAALLLFGTNLWPGVFLGSFLINIRELNQLADLIVPFGVAIGSTLGIVASVILIRRFNQFPKKIYSEKDIFLFLFLSCFVSSVITATIDVTILYGVGVVTVKNYSANWIYWFVGDAMGGLIFAPLALFFSNQSRKYWLRSVSKVLIPVGFSFVLFLLIFQYLNSAEQNRGLSEFNKKVEFTFKNLEKDLHSNIDVLSSLRSFYESSETVTEEEFQLFSSQLRKHRPNIHALAWTPVNAKTPDLFQMKYAEPGEFHERLLPDLSSLYKASLATKNVVVSEPLQTAAGPRVFLFLSLEDPLGVLSEVVYTDQILKDIETALNDKSYRVTISDITRQPFKIVAQTSGENNFNNNYDFERSARFSVGDRIWEVTIKQDSTVHGGSFLNAQVFLLISLTFTFLLCALLLTIANRVITVEKIVDDKTQHLLDLNAQLKKASETKSEFLANMSHEIRTPLNVILGMSDLLDESSLNEEQTQYVDISRKAGQNLLDIVNDILDISKIESGLITLENTPVDLHEIVRGVCAMFSIKAKKKNLTLNVKLSDDTKGVYMGDPTRLRQILANLVGNAIKFTMQGSVDVQLARNTRTELPGNLLFEIKDTGIGISPEIIPDLFQPFTQADSSITRKFGGTGLGLSISKRLVQMMNGEIHVESELERGSRFYFTLDLPELRGTNSQETNPGSKTAASEKTTLAGKSLSILIVDDTDDNRVLIKAYLKNTPHKIDEASNGKQAFEMIQIKRYDLVLMDMQMPVEDGFTATQKIRQWEQEHQKTPTVIWALTAYALQNEIERSLAVGCNLHLVKPLRKADLLQHIARLKS